MWEGINKQGSDGLRKTRDHETEEHRMKAGWWTSFLLSGVLEWHWSISMTAARQDGAQLYQTHTNWTCFQSKIIPKQWNLKQIFMVHAQSVACPFLIDPSSRATEWLCTHLKQNRLEVINQQVNTHTHCLCVCSFMNPKPSVWGR